MTRRTVEEAQEWAKKEIHNARVRQLSALKIYHQREIKKIDEELEHLLEGDVEGINY